MVAQRVETRYTIEDYFAVEQATDYRNEFVDGQIIAMAGGSLAHNRVERNVLGQLEQQLRGQPCEPFSGDIRVKAGAAGHYRYPDVSVVCGPPEIERTPLDTLVNPTVLIEVLSPSTEADDRGAKTRAYRLIPSLQEYLLIAQDRPAVEHYQRRANGWLLTDYSGLDDCVPLPSISCTLPLRDIYARVTFPSTGTPPEPDGGQP